MYPQTWQMISTISSRAAVFIEPTLWAMMKRYCKTKSHAFVEFGHVMRRSIFPVIVFADNRSVTQLFPAKLIFPALWKACDFVLQYSFLNAHVVGWMNTAADLLSRTEVSPIEKLEKSTQNDFQTKALKVNIQVNNLCLRNNTQMNVNDKRRWVCELKKCVVESNYRAIDIYDTINDPGPNEWWTAWPDTWYQAESTRLMCWAIT